ncbi:MAG: hypothetical protein M9884_17650, partial [Rhodocyclaceae bacterium]|nr:hypothetical protein [Rhodocyclaceae bacterium]
MIDFADDSQREMREQLAGDDNDRAKMIERLRVLGGQINRLVDAIADLGISESLAVKLKAAEAERDSLRRQRATVPEPVHVAALWHGVKSQLRAMLDASD